MKKKTIVVSGVNLVEGGTLTILKQCLDFLDGFLDENEEYRVIALIHKKTLFDYRNIEYKEIKWTKKNWLYRAYCEYIYFFFLSRKLEPYLWLSLHDITPTVKAEIRAVYCHNPTPFQKVKMQDLKYSYKVFLFTLFYRFLYRINIHKNHFVIVQQDWLREAFANLLKVSSKKIIVAYPFVAGHKVKIESDSKKRNNVFTFFYPSLPRPFKNFEVVCQAAKKIEEKRIENFKVYLTLSGDENTYSHNLYEKYKDVKTVDFIGLLNRQDVEKYYEKTDCLIFPSRLETWGLPLSEFSVYNKPILAANLPYAKEAASNSRLTAFFDVDNPDDLAIKMEALIKGDDSFLSECSIPNIKEPFTQSWKELFDVLLSVR